MFVTNSHQKKSFDMSVKQFLCFPLSFSTNAVQTSGLSCWFSNRKSAYIIFSWDFIKKKNFN